MTYTTAQGIIIHASRPHAFLSVILESDPEIDVNY